MRVRRRYLVFLPVLFCLGSLSISAFAGDVPTAVPSSLSPAFLTTTLLAALVGALSQAVNTGKLLGQVTVPKPWLPWLGLALSFLLASGVSLGAQPAMTAATFYVAFLAGLGALLANGGGAAIHSALTAHLTSRGVAATEAAAGSGPDEGNAARAITSPDAVSKDSQAPAAHFEPLKRTPYRSPAFRPYPDPATVGGLFLAEVEKMRKFRLWAASTALLSVGVIGIFGGLLTGCPITPQTQTAIQAAEVLGACIESVYATDSQKTPPTKPLQIALDEAATCGADVVPIVNVLGKDSDPGKATVVQAAKDNASAVHAGAMAHPGN
jgi:hypothetical protein